MRSGERESQAVSCRGTPQLTGVALVVRRGGEAAAAASAGPTVENAAAKI